MDNITMNVLAEIKNKSNITRDDIARLLASVGEPGERQDEKIKTVKELGLKNSQGIGVEVDLPSYQEF